MSTTPWKTNAQNPFGTSSGSQNTQNSLQNLFGLSPGAQDAQNPFGASFGSSNSPNSFGASPGSQNTLNSFQNPFGVSSGSQNPQNPFGSASETQNTQSFFGASAGSQNVPQNQPSFFESSVASSDSQNPTNTLPFGPNLSPINAPFTPTDWNFQPGNQDVHFVGAQGTGMTDEAKQIAVQIQAIRDNLSITQDESTYLIGQLKASLPLYLRNQLADQ
uniref:Uncharacterized protein n=1 Tax=Caenorhabditis japonica TaxID=281687 RepID=A0A8R1DTY0_CAEJA